MNQDWRSSINKLQALINKKGCVNMFMNNNTETDLFTFICKCKNEWLGRDVGDGFCNKCGEYYIEYKVGDKIKKDGE